MLVYLFGAFVLGGGILLIISAFRDRLNNAEGWLLLCEGIIGIIAGILVFALPGVTTLILVYLIAAWALVTGILEVIAAFRLRMKIENKWRLGVVGIVSIIFGILLTFRPLTGAVTILWVIGIYAILFGVLLIILAFRLRSWNNRTSLPS